MHYLTIPRYTSYINGPNVLEEVEKRELFMITLRHMSFLSRRILRALKEQRKNDIDIHIVGSHLDSGMWLET